MEIQLNQVLLQALNFGVLFFVLTKFLFRPIVNILDARANRIQESMAAAEKSLAEQAKLEEKKAAELAKAEKKASQIISDARAESKKLGESLITQAKEESQKVVAKQEANFLSKLTDLERDMQQRMANLVVDTTKQVLADTLSPTELKAITSKISKKLK